MRIERIHLALIGGAHRPARAVKHDAAVDRAFAGEGGANLVEFSHAASKMRSNAPLLLMRWRRADIASSYKLFRLPPDQKIRSKSSVCFCALRIANILRKI